MPEDRDRDKTAYENKTELKKEDILSSRRGRKERGKEC
jgi:hypothetical protein